MFNFLRNKKVSNKKINKFYSQHLYTGLNGILMRYCHRQLEEKIFNKKHKNILEIGAGSEPHFKYLKNQNCKYTILEVLKDKNSKSKSFKKFKYVFYNGKKIPFKKNTFDRIILSHTLEHIPFPEMFLLDAYSKLKKGGMISISLPTDPGAMWRLGRFYNKIFKIKKTLKISSLEYDYMNSIEHINSIFSLLNIIRYRFKGKISESFVPFKIKSPDINLFYNVHISK